MLKCLLTMTLVYIYGHPMFDGWRPARLEHPLQMFYAEVNAAAWNGQQVLAGFDDARLRRHMRDYLTRVDAQIKQPN